MSRSRLLFFYNLPLGVFGLSAVVAAWAAYDGSAALLRLAAILVALGLAIVIATQPLERLWLIAGILVGWGGFLALVFLLVFDWQHHIADLALVGRVVAGWVALQPTLPPEFYQWASVTTIAGNANQVAGQLAFLFPLALAATVRSWPRSGSFGQVMVVRTVWTVLAGLSLLLMGAGLLLSSSRGAWLALSLGLGAWGLWALVTAPALARPTDEGDWPDGEIKAEPSVPLRVVLSSLLVIAALAWIAWLAFAARPSLDAGLMPVRAFGRLPSGESRLELFQNTAYLVQDYALTGAGLGTFPGQYSHYMLGIPVYLYGYGHNVYLDVALEQGLLALAAVLLLLAGSAWFLFSIAAVLRRTAAATPERANLRLLAGAVLASLIVFVIHGLLDDPLYGPPVSPLLFVAPAMAAGLAKAAAFIAAGSQEFEQLAAGKSIAVFGGMSLPAAGAAALLVLVVSAVFWRPLASVLYADLGAVQMARYDLAGFPTLAWDRGENLGALQAPERLFQSALNFNPHNRTALHRLGLIDMLRRDYPSAVDHLGQALALDPGHRGLQKALGYSYLWAGQPERAQPLLAPLAEVPGELDAYIHWWRGLGRDDLSAAAEIMLVQLNGSMK